MVTTRKSNSKKQNAQNNYDVLVADYDKYDLEVPESTINTVNPLNSLPLDVDEAMLTLISSFKTSSQVKVQGKVEKVDERYDYWLYGDLAGQEGKIRFRLPKGKQVPLVGSTIVINGVFKIQPARFHEGLETMLCGKVDPLSQNLLVGIEENYKPFNPKRINPPLRLQTWLEHNQGDLNKLLVIGTKTGISDVKATLSQEGFNHSFNSAITNMVDRFDVLNFLAGVLKRKDITAIALARGGGDLSTLAAWEDEELITMLAESGKAFYTALGHSTNLLLIDRFADETFATPSAFGSAFGQCLRQFYQKIELIRKADIDNKEKSELKNQCNLAIKEMKTSQTSNKQLASVAATRQQIIYAVVILWIITVVVMYFGLYR